MNAKILKLIYVNYIVLMIYTVYGIITRIAFGEYIKKFIFYFFCISVLAILAEHIYKFFTYKEPDDGQSIEPIIDEKIGENSQEELGDLLDEMSRHDQADNGTKTNNTEIENTNSTKPDSPLDVDKVQTPSGAENHEQPVQEGVNNSENEIDS